MKRLRLQSGFTVVEALLAVLLLSLVGITGSQLILRTTEKSSQSVTNKKASLLGEMALEKYNSYALENFAAMTTHDVALQNPTQFFNSAMPGYERYSMTTQTAYSTNRSSASLTVTISWSQGGASKTLVFTKAYAAGTPLAGGASVQAWVKWRDPTNASCMASSSQIDIITNCPGIAGITVSARASKPGSPSQGTTNDQGGVVLSGVALGDAIPFTITGNVPSNYNVPPGPGFSQGFYAKLSASSYALTVTSSVVVDNAGSLVTALFTHFVPAGTVEGNIINDSSTGGSTANMSVTLGTGTWLAQGGTFVQVGPGLDPQVISDAGGHYAYYNVVPENLAVVPLGRAGSSPEIQTTSPSFLYGYKASVPSYPITSWNNASMPPVAAMDVHVQRMGWLAVHTLSAVDNSVLANVTVGPRTMAYDVVAPAAPTDVNGVIRYYNFLPANGLSFIFNASRSPQPGLDRGFFSRTVWTCVGGCMDRENTVNLSAAPGYLFTGQFYDDNPTAATPHVRAADGKVYSFQYNNWTTFALTDSNGVFQLDGISPNNGTLGTGPGLWDAWIWITFYLNDSVVLPFTVTGHIRDNAMAGQPAAGALLSMYDMVGKQSATSGSDGSYTLNATVHPILEMGYRPSLCTPMPVDMSSTTLLAAQCTLKTDASLIPSDQYHINTGVTTIQPLPEYIYDPSYRGGWTEFGGLTFNVQGLPFINVQDYGANLANYQVTGRVTESGNPVSGLMVTDSFNGVWVGTTNGSGVYSGWVKVQANRSISVTVAANQNPNGFTYTGASQSLGSLPVPATPFTPLTIDLAVGRVGGGGGL